MDGNCFFSFLCNWYLCDMTGQTSSKTKRCLGERSWQISLNISTHFSFFFLFDARWVGHIWQRRFLSFLISQNHGCMTYRITYQTIELLSELCMIPAVEVDGDHHLVTDSRGEMDAMQSYQWVHPNSSDQINILWLCKSSFIASRCNITTLDCRLASLVPITRGWKLNSACTRSGFRCSHPMYSNWSF